MYLFVSTLTNDNFSTKTDNLAKSVAETLASDKWLNTQETAWSLFSLLPYYSAKKTSGGSYIVKNDIAERTDTFTQASISENLPVSYKFPGQMVTIQNTGSNTLYGTVICSGMSVAGTEFVQNKGISLQVDGINKLKNIKPGEEVSLRVQIANTSSTELKNLVLTVPIGTCLEFANERISNESYSSSTYTYQDIRDDVIYTYFDLNKNGTVTLYFKATAAYSGDFTIPAIYAEAMYDNNIRAVYPGFKVKMLK
jgi:uncharacterized protein YfaS (alpha-2-macroglobulin family)